MDARGARESIDAANRNVSTARRWAESSAASLARARKRLAEIRDEVDRCEREASDASKGLKEAKRHLKDLERRYEVIDVDDEEETPKKKKKQRLSRDSETQIAPSVDDEGVEMQDIELVMSLAGCSMAKAAKALKENGSNWINASASLMVASFLAEVRGR